MRTPIGMPVDRLVACNGATEGTGLARAGSMGAGLTEVTMQEIKPEPVSLDIRQYYRREAIMQRAYPDPNIANAN